MWFREVCRCIYRKHHTASFGLKLKMGPLTKPVTKNENRIVSPIFIHYSPILEQPDYATIDETPYIVIIIISREAVLFQKMRREMRERLRNEERERGK